MKKKIKVLLCLCMLLAATAMLSGCGSSGGSLLGGSSTKIDLTDYITLEYYGSDGDGTAFVDFDFSQMEIDYSGYDGSDLSSEVLEKMSEISSLESSITYEADVTSGLSNGDTVTVTVTYDEEAADEINVKVTGELTKEFTVEGLE